MKQTSEEISFYELVKLLKKNKKLIVIITSSFFIISIIVSLFLDNYYSATCLIVPSQSKETSLVTMSAFGGFSLTSKVETPIVTNIRQTLTTNRFLDKFIEKYLDDERVFDDDIVEIRKSNLEDSLKGPKIYEVALKSLRENIINIKTQTDQSISISVTLKDRFFAVDLLNEIMDSLSINIHRDNVKFLKKDIEFYNSLLEKIKDPTESSNIRKELKKKSLKAAMMKNNIFTIIERPYVPYKKSKPSRVLIVLASMFFGFFSSILYLMARNYFRKE
ncbi:MAG: hypothetical protein CSA15_12345 [Candidatus Delongbacteria bacterium]|nr:MAG: hypothetical protein CSA15_12345 [Candidatus Delongbacteria bacterium]